MTFPRFLRSVTVLSFMSVGTLACAYGQESRQISFRTVQEGMIVVPVKVNGAGPFNFLLDTGCTKTLIDRRLAEELHLPPVGKALLDTASGEHGVTLVHSDSLSIADANIGGLDVIAVDTHGTLMPRVRGTLGEDFLRNFDLLIDNRRHVLQFDIGPGTLMQTLIGERLPLVTDGVPDPDRELVVKGHFYAHEDMKLVLDSGATTVVLFSKASRRGITLGSVQPVLDVLGGRLAVDVPTPLSLALGNKQFRGLPIVATLGTPAIQLDALLPTSVFDSIFISHSGRFIIIDPALRPEMMQSKLPSSPGTEISDVRSGQNISAPVH